MSEYIGCDIIIPTWNNLQYLIPCVSSIFQNTNSDSYRIVVVNNGEPEHMTYLPKSDKLKIVQNSENLGWDGGLKSGLKESDSPYVIFMNDDTYIPISSGDWMVKMVRHFLEPDCAAVGPSSNVVMGKQNIFYQSREKQFKAKFLIGFCVMIKRDFLESAGGIDDSLPGGDDLDLSIRLRDLGKYLMVDKESFVYHHGFKTGERVEGGPNQPGGWNSLDKIEKTNFALINKHGIYKFLDLWS